VEHRLPTVLPKINSRTFQEVWEPREQSVLILQVEHQLRTIQVATEIISVQELADHDI